MKSNVETVLPRSEDWQLNLEEVIVIGKAALKCSILRFKADIKILFLLLFLVVSQITINAVSFLSGCVIHFNVVLHI